MSDPLRIALLLDPLTQRARGGDHAPHLARELLACGHCVQSFGSPAAGAPAPRAASDAEPGNAQPASRPRAAGLAVFRPEVLVAYDALSPMAYLGARTARRLRAALVLVEPGRDASDLRLPRRFLNGLGERLWGAYVRSATRHVVALDPLAEAQAHARGFPLEQVSLLPEGVDLGFFRPGLSSQLVSQYRIRGRILLYTGPIELERDLATLVAAFAASVGQRLDWSLVLAGEGSARAALRAQAERLGVGDRVLFLPRPSTQDLPGLMGASTLLAQPGTGVDVRGRQVARAMACGLPVVAADLPRLRHLVRAEETGLVARSKDLSSWTAALQRMSGSPVLRQKWGLAARAFAEQRLAWPAIGEAFQVLLQRARQRALAAA